MASHVYAPVAIIGVGMTTGKRRVL